MSTTQPIKDTKDIEALKDYFLNCQKNLRNYALFCTGVNTALRIGDILNLTWGDVYDFRQKIFRKHITVCEHKTGKENTIALNENVTQSLSRYLQSLSDIKADAFLFPGRNPDTPLSRTQAYRIIKHACADLNLPEHISCHSLRKTFGYHAWASGANPTVLMIIFNHSSFRVTKRYLGIEQDDKDKIFLTLNL